MPNAKFAVIEYEYAPSDWMEKARIDLRQKHQAGETFDLWEYYEDRPASKDEHMPLMRVRFE